MIHISISKNIFLFLSTYCIEKDKIELSHFAQNNVTPDHHYFSYTAPQGRFDIAVDSKVLDVVDCDSTVELLADFIARQLVADHNKITVVAYEGVGKGAIANAEV